MTAAKDRYIPEWGLKEPREIPHEDVGAGADQPKPMVQEFPPISDEKLSEKVQKILTSPTFATGEVEFGVHEGRVLLRGSVDSLEARESLVERIKVLPGVTVVENRLEVPSATGGTASA